MIDWQFLKNVAMELINDFYDKICCETKPFFPIPYSFDFSAKDIVSNSLTFQSNQITTTKYNLINFLPKAVISQYKRFANLYFLIIAIISSIPNITPLNPVLIWMPLIGVLTISIIKQAYEDYQRFKLDKQINNQYEVLVIRNNEEISISWKEVQVGDICHVLENQTFPADLLLLSSNHPDGTAYIQTASLDGEKTSKARYAFPVLNRFKEAEDFINLRGNFWGRLPNSSLDQFKADLLVSPNIKLQITDNKQLLYRGAKLKNTAWVWGLAIYTGQCTKIMLNSKSFTHKISTVQKKLNYMLLTFLAIQFTICIIIASLAIASIDEFLIKHWYISFRKNSDVSLFFTSFLMYFIDFSSLIPISLIVSIEIIKLAQSYFIDFDKLMFSHQKERGVLAKSAALNEQLGQIEYVFTDKTGTLTKNKMVFDIAIIGDRQFNFAYNQELKQYDCKRLQAEIISQIYQKLPIRLKLVAEEDFVYIDTLQKLIHQYLMCILVCNSINSTTTAEGQVNYQSESPDQLALIRAAKSMGYELIKRENNCLKVSVNRQLQNIQILETFNFTSDRKRMSVIIKWDRHIMLYIKGADNVILERSKPTKFKVEEQISLISRKGLRTLLLGVKLISPAQYARFKQKLDQSSHSNRQKIIEEFSEQFQQGVEILGATGLLDELQDGVPSTLKDLQRANIKVWMLTGDKFQTALEIGKSCRLIQSNYEIIECRTSQSSITLFIDDLERAFQNGRSRKYSLVIEGSRLNQILKDKYLGKRFAKFSIHFQTVICCRMLPIQKAEIVKLIRKNLNKICLAIGDGGNDVSMIKEGNIGIGIYGEEGMNAVQASDYAIPEFRMIWRLLFVHGRWNYIRISEMILYFTYKSILFTIPRIVFSFICHFSGQPIYDDVYIALYNIVFTSVPLIIRALFDQDINYVYKREAVDLERDNLKNEKGGSVERIQQQQYLPPGFVIDKNFRNLLPKVYFIGQKNQVFNFSNCLLWTLESALVSLFSVLLIIFTIGNRTLNQNGYNSDLWIMSVSVYTSVIMICTLKLAIHVRHWTLIILAAITLCSLAPYLSYVWISNYYFSKYRVQGTIMMSFRTGTSYLSVLIASILMLTINGIVIYVNFHKNKRLSKMQMIMKEINSEKNQKIDQNVFLSEQYINGSRSEQSYTRHVADIQCNKLKRERQ